MHQSNTGFLRAFPTALRDHAAVALSVLPENSRMSPDFSVRVADENLVLPYRIYHNPGLINTASLE
jgi:hypothetical protein